MVKLDLACGTRKQEGFTGVDKIKTDQVDLVWDLTQYPWPYEDESVDEIFSAHYIEHVVDLVAFYKEMHRILKMDGRAILQAPYGKHNRAWQDPTHVRAIVEESFLYLSRNFRQQAQITHYLPDINFDVTVAYFGIDPAWANRAEEVKSFAIKHYWNVVQDIQAVLVKKP